MPSLTKQLNKHSNKPSKAKTLHDGARVAVIGGGPAGAFFSYFLLAMAWRAGLRLQVDIYEPRDFSRPGPAGCNMCGGVIYEGLVQKLAAEGIHLPPSVVQHGIDACALHMDVGTQAFETPIHEKRIATVYRGGGPLGNTDHDLKSFDSYLLDKALAQGATLLPARVEAVERVDDQLQVQSRDFGLRRYDFLAISAGVNTNVLKLLQPVVPGYHPPAALQIRAAEYRLGAEAVEHFLGHAFHIFLLDLPGLDFAGLIPKGEYVTVALLGQAITPAVFDAFLKSPQVRSCLPPGWQPDQAVCRCAPRINVGSARHPFGDRVVFLGDSGVSRLYKDGIGAAYRAAKAAATTAVFHGVASEDFRRHLWPVYRRITGDNVVGRFVFSVIRQLQHWRFARQAMMAMVASEPTDTQGAHTMSAVLWDMFSGSATYREILLRTLHPAFLGPLCLRMAWALLASARQSIPWPSGKPQSAGAPVEW